MNTLRVLGITLTLLGLTACATLGTAEETPPLATLAAFTIEDLTAALADATVHQDSAAVTCYSTLLKYVGAARLPETAAVKGVFTLNQRKRDLLLGSDQLTPILRDLNLGCAAYLADERLIVFRLGLIGAGTLK